VNWHFWKTQKQLSPGGGTSVEAMNNFTPRAQQTLALARKEADRFNHNFVGTEHLLLGLIRLGQGTAVNVLRRRGLDLESVRIEVEKQVGHGPDRKVIGTIPYTPRVKKVLALAAREAHALNHTYVGTEHILLGLLEEGDGVAAKVLKGLQVDIEQTRQDILRELDPNFVPDDSHTEHPDLESSPALVHATLARSRDVIDADVPYDVYCVEYGSHVVIYRNARFKGTKRLPGSCHDRRALFVELALGDGQISYVAQDSILKFCRSGTASNRESPSGEG
jgi:hypothetical protein